MALAEFLGVLESPLDTGRPQVGDSVPLRGWASHAFGPVSDVVATGSWLTMPVALSTGLRRADVLAAYPERPHGATGGFAGELPLPPDAGPELSLQVEVRVQGRAVHCWHRRWIRESPDAAWQRWLEGAAATTEPVQGDLPAITWLIASGTACGHAATAADLVAWRNFGGPGSCAVALDTDTRLAIDAPALPAVVTTPYVGLVMAGDRPRAQALPWLGRALADQPDLVVADHDHVLADGRRMDPVLKPGWHLLLADHPDIATRAWLRRTNQRDAALPLRVAQLRMPLLSAPPANPRPPQAQARSTRPAPSADAVAVIIPTCLADPGLLGRTLDGVFAAATGRPVEVLLLLNNLRGHTLDEARSRLARWPASTLYLEGAFNWSAFNNAGARATTAPQLLFLNDDVTPEDRHWLDAMQTCLARPGVGAVGAVLRYPDGRLQHAGIQVHGQPELMCRHLFRFCRGDETRVQRWLAHDLPVSAVTGACLLTQRTVFDATGGFDEALPLVYNDVDYGLRLRESGWSSVVSAQARLCHHEGWSRGGLVEDADRARFVQRWQSRWPDCDPHGHPWLARDRDDWMPDFHRPMRPVIERPNA